MNSSQLFAAHALSLAIGATLATPMPVYADDDRGRDFGAKVEHLLKARSEKLFGFNRPLDESAPATSGAYRAT